MKLNPIIAQPEPPARSTLARRLYLIVMLLIGDIALIGVAYVMRGFRRTSSPEERVVLIMAFAAILYFAVKSISGLALLRRVQ